MASELEKKKKGRGYDFSGLAQMAPRKEFKFGPRDSEMASVDASLARLFQYLTVETSGILVQPQWKHFRHMEMMRNDQIRLSNGIWRSWHLQFQKNKKPLFCQFAINPLVDMETHHDPQAIVIEGKYWKRQTDAVACEYRKWRLFHRERNKRSNGKPAPHNAAPAGTATINPMNSQNRDNKDLQQQMQVDTNESYRTSNVLQALDDLLPDSLFVEGRPYMRPFLDSSNMLQQPNLGMLNPTLDELLEKLEPMEVMFGQTGGPSATSVPQESSVQFFQPGEPQYGEAQSGPVYTTNQQPNFMTKPVAMQQQDQRRPDIVSYGNQFGGFSTMQTDTYSLSPSAFLSMPMKERTLPSAAAMEIGTPPTGPGFVPPGQVKMETSSLSQATTPQSHFVPAGASPFHPPSAPPPVSSGPITRSMSDPLFTGLQVPGQHAPPSRYPQHAPPLLLPLQQQPQGAFSSAQTQTSPPPSASPATTPHVNPSPSFQYSQHQPSHHNTSKDSSEFPYPSPPLAQPYGGPTDYWSPQDSFSQQRKTSTELHTPFTSPPPPGTQLFSPQQLSSGRNEPPLPEANLQVLAEQVQLLEQQQYLQLKEIEKQQSQATQEYLNLLQQYITQSGSHPSQQQQQVLQSVLSDPATVNILKAILLQGEEKVAGRGQKGLTPKQKHGETEGENPSKSQILSPIHLAKGSSVSDFQSRVVMAAAYQAASIASSAPTTPTLTSSLTTKSLSLSPTGPLSPTTSSLHDAVLQKFKNARNLSQEEKKLYQEIRRQSHISAEQKRRGSIKQGFEHLQLLVVNPSSFPSGKVSKAVILEKTVDFMQHQHAEREARERHIAELREEITQLNNSIALSQQQLPASGAPITRQRFEENKRYFREYLQDRTQHNYKFWLFSIILQQLFDTYNTTVSTGSREELCQTVLTWCEQNCTLPALRPVVMNTLKEISLKTCILSDPSKVPQQLSQQPPAPPAAAAAYTRDSSRT